MQVTYRKLESNIFLKYLNPVFLETGTYIGDSVQYAIEAGFERIISIELSDHYYALSSERFRDYPNVSIIKGDSGKILWDVIKDIDSTITFWLDGHFSKGDTAIGQYCSPIIVELQQIAAHHIKDHTILIDDMQSWKNTGGCVCDLYPCNNNFGFKYSDIIDNLLAINPKYQFKFEDHFKKNNIIVAREL